MSANKLKLATPEVVDSILTYLKEDVGNCLYMYIDIKKYGIEHPEMKVWYEESTQEGIILVVMKYYTSISFYSRNTEWAKEAVLELIQIHGPASISARVDLAEQLQEDLPQYAFHSGWVFEYDRFKDLPSTDLSYVGKEDLYEVAELLCSDPSFGAIYQVDNLCTQLIERQETGMGRNLVVRQEGKIVAHIATFAECDDIAVTSAMIVHEDHRNSFYGSILESNIIQDLKKEKFRVFTFVIEKKRKKLLDALKQKSLGEYGRLSLKTDL